MLEASDRYLERRARFELLSGAGALVLGAGVALVFRQLLGPLALPLLVIGLVAHGWGMMGKHLLDTSGTKPMPRWSDWVYWACWALIAGLVLYLPLRVW